MSDERVEAPNACLLGVDRHGVINVMRPPTILSKPDAYALAAWLVVLAGDDADTFRKYLAAVRET